MLEAHVLDFLDELYEKEVTIELCKKIRNDMQFSDDAALRAAIADDIAKVRMYFTDV